MYNGKQTVGQILASEITHGEAKKELEAFQRLLEGADPARSIFWSRGRHFSRDRNAPSSENKELSDAFRWIMRVLGEKYHSVNSLLVQSESSYFLSGCTATQLDQFWRTVSEIWASRACGEIGVAATSSPAETNLRMFEFPIIMENPNITDVFILKGDLVPVSSFPVIGRVNAGEIEILSFEQIEEFGGWDIGGCDKLNIVFTELMPQLPPVSIPKEQWAERQKQEWYDVSKRHLMNILTGKADKYGDREDRGGDVHLIAEPSSYSLVDAEVRFLGEVSFSLKELDRLEARHNQLTDPDSIRLSALSISREMGRLKHAMKVLDDYPFIAEVRAPFNELEKEYGVLYARSEYNQETKKSTITGYQPKIEIFTNTLGRMFLAQDDTLTSRDKHGLWGIWSKYNWEAMLMRTSPEHEIEQHRLGKPKDMENYTERKLEEMLLKARDKIAQGEKREKGGRLG